MDLAKLVSSEVGKALPRWGEVKRRTPQEFFGLKPGDELPPEVAEDVPKDVGTEYTYRLEAGGMRISFLRAFYNSRPLTTQHFLLFYFGEGTANPKGFDNPLSAAEGFEFLRQAKIRFTVARFGGTNEPYAELESQNMDLYRSERGWGERRQFTERGKMFMDALISFKGSMKSWPGMKPDEQELFGWVLDVIDSEYKAGRIEPRSWFYT